MDAPVPSNTTDPDWRSYWEVLRLLLAALVDGIKLPLRLAIFLTMRRRLARDLGKTLERHRFGPNMKQEENSTGRGGGER